MANLHRAQYANNPRHAPRNPTTFLTYLGSTADGYPEPTWLVHGSETTDVSTCGTGHPTRGMQYLGAAQDPDTGRGWMVRCDRQSSRVTPRLAAPDGWNCYGANFRRYFGLSNASIGEDPAPVPDIVEPLLYRYSGAGSLFVTYPVDEEFELLCGEFTYPHARLWWEFVITGAEVVALDFDATTLILEPGEDNVSGLVCLEIADLTERWAITLPDRIVTVVVP